MTMQLVDDPGDLHNAAFFAVACELAYLPASAGKVAYREKLGLDVELISVDNTQVYVGQSDTAIVAAFRGSEAPNSLDGFKDWLLTNANNFLILPEGRIGTDFAAAGVGARFHKGFMQAIAEIWEPFYAAVDNAFKARERKVWVTGHSLGGALALLAAWRLQQQFIPVYAVTTFGAPMVGNDATAAAFEREFPGKIFRYVDSLDVVPKLPMVSLIANAYQHCLAEEMLGQAAAAGTAADVATVFEAFTKRAKQGILDATLMDELWDCLKERIAHHMMDNYQARLLEKQKSSV